MKLRLQVVTRDVPGGPGVKDPPCRAWLGKYDPSRQQQSLRATTTEPERPGAHAATKDPAPSN